MAKSPDQRVLARRSRKSVKVSSGIAIVKGSLRSIVYSSVQDCFSKALPEGECKREG